MVNEPRVSRYKKLGKTIEGDSCLLNQSNKLINDIENSFRENIK